MMDHSASNLVARLAGAFLGILVLYPLIRIPLELLGGNLNRALFSRTARYVPYEYFKLAVDQMMKPTWFTYLALVLAVAFEIWRGRTGRKVNAYRFYCIMITVILLCDNDFAYQVRGIFEYYFHPGFLTWLAVRLFAGWLCGTAVFLAVQGLESFNVWVMERTNDPRLSS